MHVVEGTTPTFHTEMASAVFCLGAPGTYGGWGRRATQSALHGCIPVFVQDNTTATLEELLPWEQFAVRVPEARVPHLHADLQQLLHKPGRVAALQRGLACVWPRFVYSTAFGAVAQEDGTDDAFESVMTVLRRRLARRRDDWPPPGERSAAERAAFLAQSQLADPCHGSSVVAGGPGGAPRGAGVPPRLPCRHWGHPLRGECPNPAPERMLASPTGPPGGAVCVGVQPPCFWPRLLNATANATSPAAGAPPAAGAARSDNNQTG